MLQCRLCEKEYCYISRFCDKCRRIKHLINLYEDRVYSVLENVLVREVDKQENKVKAEINKVIEGKKFALRQPPSEVD
jgi:hypothetical protein